LIKYDTAVQDDRHGDHGFGKSIFAAETQQEKAEANDGELPDDEMIPERCDRPACNRIQLRTSRGQDHVSEKGIEYVQYDNPEKHREESMTVTVDVAAPKLIPLSAKAASATAEERIAAQHGGGLLAAIGLISLFHIQKKACFEMIINRTEPFCNTKNV
jgi:hypothetical protein